MRKIVIEEYSKEWLKEFEILKSIFLQYMGHINVVVEHVGSTSVAGLAAKPILDIDIIIDDQSRLNEIISILSKLGYIHRGDLGIKGREVFGRTSNQVPYHNNINYQFAHNLYVCAKDSLALQNHLKFSDYLRSNPNIAFEYSILKKELASKYRHDINSYVKNKTKFITKILSITGLNENEIKHITSENMK